MEINYFGHCNIGTGHIEMKSLKIMSKIQHGSEQNNVEHLLITIYVLNKLIIRKSSECISCARTESFCLLCRHMQAL